MPNTVPTSRPHQSLLSRRTRQHARRSTALVLPAAALALALVPSAASAATPATAPRAASLTAAAASGGTILDATTPVDVAALANVAVWLRPTSALSRDAVPKTSVLVMLPGTAKTPKVLSVAVPSRTDHLTLGTDASGKATVVLSTPKGLYAAPVSAGTTDPVTPTKVPGTTSKDGAPGLRRGVLTFSRTERVKGRTRSTVRIGSLTSARSTVAWGGATAQTVTDTALGTARTVVFETFRARDSGVGDTLRMLRPGGTPRTLLTTSIGGASDNGMGRATVSGDGSTVSASRWNDGGGHPNDVNRFALRNGKRLGTTKLVRTPEPVLTTQLPLQSGGALSVPVGADCVFTPNGPNAAAASSRPCPLRLVL
jgi:hypothetical protein